MGVTDGVIVGGPLVGVNVFVLVGPGVLVGFGVLVGYAVLVGRGVGVGRGVVVTHGASVAVGRSVGVHVAFSVGPRKVMVGLLTNPDAVVISWGGLDTRTTTVATAMQTPIESTNIKTEMTL